MPDDFLENVSTAGAISVGGISAGSIEMANDQDWFGADLVAGRTYRIELDGIGFGTALSDPYFRGIYDASGTLIPGTTDDDDGPGLNSLLEFTAPTSGRYFLAAGAYGSNTGDYRLSLTDLGFDDDFSNTTSTTGFVPVGAVSTGALEQPNDQDWFQVELVAGHEYQIDVRGNATSDGTLSDPYLRGIHNSSGELLDGTTNDDGGTGLNSQLSFTPTTSGTFYIAAGGYSSSVGTYEVEVQDLGVTDDQTDTVDTSGTVAVDGSVTGTLETANDTDWFRVELVAGREYVIDLKGAPTSDGTLSDPFLRGIHSADGTLLASSTNDDGGTGLNSQLTFSPDADGVYYISAGAYGNSAGTYTLAVANVGSSDDFSADISTIGSLSASGIITGSIEVPGDNDWFGADLIAGHTYRMALTGSYSGGGTLGDPFIRGIHDSSGTLLPGSTNDDGGGGLDSLLEFTAASTGRHFIAAGAFGDSTGTYTLAFEDLGAADDFADDRSTTGTVSVDGSVSGSVEESGDQDWFSISLESGRAYHFDLEGSPTDMGTLPDTFLNGIYDSSGALIAGTTNDDGGAGLNSLVDFTPTSAGTYFVSVGGYADNQGTYTLSVSTDAVSRDDFAGDSSTSGSVSLGGSSTGSIETAEDQDWFSVSLTAGRVYQVDLEGAATSGGTLSDPFFRGLYDSSGALVSGTGNDDGGTGLNSQVSFTAASTGTFYLAAGAYGAGTGTYKVSIADAGGTDDFAATLGTTGAISIDGTATGNIESASDQDWFKVRLTAGDTYQINLEGSATTGETLSDPLLAGVYDASGTLVSGTTNDDGGTGLNSQIDFTPTTTGDYFISASAFGAGVGTYKLSLSQTSTGSPTDDFTETIETTGTVPVGGSSTGSIETIGDNDWFAVNLVEGQTYRLDLEGVETGVGTLADPYLRGIFNSAGTEIPGAFNDDGGAGTNSRLEFTASSTGQHYISAGAYGGTGTYKLSVSHVTTAPAPSSGFEITIAYSGDAAYQAYFDNAAATWESIITGDLPDVNHARLGLIDDLLIEASVTYIDGAGSILGQAGPREFRTGSSLPTLGMMQFDSADLAEMVSKGILQDVIEHEMGHVLGIGTLWQGLGLKSGFNYTGANAIREYSTLLGSSATSVPLQTTGGPGTAGSHWSEAVFVTELMTGYAENSPPMPLSRVTIGSLQDMGYVVNYGAAEPYSLPGTGALIAGAVAGSSVGSVSMAASHEIIAALTTTSFNGQRFINAQDKSLSVTETPAPVKLDGIVTSADESSVLFFENTLGSDYLVQLTGVFDKNTPANASDVKGTLSEVAFFSSGVLVGQYIFDNPVDVVTALDAWRDFDLSGNNLLENRSTTAQNDLLNGLAGDDFIIGGLGDDTMNGGTGDDTVGFDVNIGDATVSEAADVFTIVSSQGTDQAGEFESFQFADRTLTTAEMSALAAGSSGLVLTGTPEADVLIGAEGADLITGLADNDRLVGNGGDDTLLGGTGNDTLNGGNGNDSINGGPESGDLRDVIFGGAGNDIINAAGGNDLVFGQDGNDTISGGFGVDDLQGQNGDDVITGSAYSDLIFGGAGDDFVNGGFGYDRINGGTGADKFYHLGIMDHGSDWVQDYSAAEGDVLLFGDSTASADDFQVNLTHTANDAGERSGDDAVEEAFVIYRPTEQIIWALVDGGGPDGINLKIGGEVFDLLA